MVGVTDSLLADYKLTSFGSVSRAVRSYSDSVMFNDNGTADASAVQSVLRNWFPNTEVYKQAKSGKLVAVMPFSSSEISAFYSLRFKALKGLTSDLYGVGVRQFRNLMITSVDVDWVEICPPTHAGISCNGCADGYENNGGECSASPAPAPTSSGNSPTPAPTVAGTPAPTVFGSTLAPTDGPTSAPTAFVVAITASLNITNYWETGFQGKINVVGRNIGSKQWTMTFGWQNQFSMTFQYVETIWGETATQDSRGADVVFVSPSKLRLSGAYSTSSISLVGNFDKGTTRQNLFDSFTTSFVIG
eukprot:TRINITY_DN3127_c0_g1_i2.p1 TRINITY_DN3127_c0_g1~~TRINITY_DN3127_c0_g1_i2.p1  ORF type:complete len:303 (+),score=54.28 TRINITY_DN3127_c0_g1_i2:536-1444(+)